MKSIRPFINWVSLNELYNTVENQENTTNDSEMIENNSSLNENLENSVDEENNIDNGEVENETQEYEKQEPKDFTEKFIQKRNQTYRSPKRRNGWWANRRR
jgi:hypothetical protein